MVEAVVRLIAETVGMASLAIDEPMSKHTTFKIGGPADLIVEPGTTNQLIALLRLFKRFNIPYFVMGNGSNLLVGDKGMYTALHFQAPFLQLFLSKVQSLPAHQRPAPL